MKILLVMTTDIPDVDHADVLDDDLAQRCSSSGPVDLFNWGVYSGDLNGVKGHCFLRARLKTRPKML